jgi:DNA invertase Pin-like site-specific DNA recombinase
MPDIKKAALYARVSTLDHGQDTEVQMRELREYAKRRGWDAVEFCDHMSGTRDDRPALKRMMRECHRRKFDAVVVWKFDRFARSVSHLLRALESFKELGIDFVSLSEAIDTSTSVGKMIFTVVAAMAEFERSLICERVRAGLALARAKGHMPGPKPVELDMAAIHARREQGESLRGIAASLGVSPALLVKRSKTEVCTA